jgi:hypothetical protein
MYVFSFSLTPKGEFGTLKQLKTVKFKDQIPNLVKQKVNVILQYKHTPLVVACLSYGYIVVVNATTQEAVSQCKLHKGNITSACFANDFEYFVTASGSFSKNHDNSIVVSKISLAMSDLFFKKINNFSSAHGKYSVG